MAKVEVGELLNWLEGGRLTKAALRTWCRCRLLREEAEDQGLLLVKISQIGLAKEMGVSPQQVHKAFKELAALGLLPD